MVASLVVTARETLEASLLVGVLLAYLSQTGNRRYHRSIWLGVGLAVALSLALGGAIFVTLGELSGPLEEGFEGGVMALAAGVLTYMVIWMHRESRRYTLSLRSSLDMVLARGSARAMVLLAFLTVFREGAEMMLLLSAVARTSSGVQTMVGAGLGFVGAAGIGYAVYTGGRRLNLRTFFRVTTVLLVVFAAGLVGQATLALQAAGVLPGTITLWDTSGLIPDLSLLGSVLRTLVGYTSQPSLLQAMFWLGYFALVLSVFVDLEATGRRTVGEEPFSPIGRSYRSALYRMIRWPRLTLVLPGLMGLALVGLLLVAIVPLSVGPFNNQGMVAWGPFRGEENDNNLFNFGMWIIWMPLLSLTTVALGRVWCGNLCPLRLVTDAARSLGDRVTGRGSPASPYLRLGWLLPVTFILMTFIVKAWPVQQVALYGAYLFLSIFGAAALVGFLFRRGTWCRYLCPVGGWLARITRLSPLALRADPTVCARCVDKPCIAGTAAAGRCPAYLNPSRLESNRYCLKCWNCAVNCPADKGALRLGWRFPGAELLRPYSPDLWESLYVATLVGMYAAVGHRSVDLVALPWPLVFFGLTALATAAYLALCGVVAPLLGVTYRRALTTVGYIFLPFEFAVAVIAFGDDALEFFGIVQPAAALLLTVGFVWSVVLGVSILRHQAAGRGRALAAAVPVGLALVAVLLVWVSWYATGVIVDVT